MTAARVRRSFGLPHAFFCPVSPVTLLVAWVVAALRRRDFKRLQKPRSSSVHGEVTSEAMPGEGALPLLWRSLVLHAAGPWGRESRDLVQPPS